MTIQLLRDERNFYAEVIQKLGTKVVYGTDWTEAVSRLWSSGTLIAANTAIRPKPVTGFQYSTVAGGLTGAKPPIWPLTPGATVQDGSVTWVCAAIDSTSLLRTPASSAWNVDSGIVATGETLAGNITQAMVDTTGATEGSNYYARNPVTMSDGSIEEAVFYVMVRSGNT